MTRVREVSVNEHEWMATTLLRNALALIGDSIDHGEMTTDAAVDRLLEVAVSVRAHLLIAAAEAVA